MMEDLAQWGFQRKMLSLGRMTMNKRGCEDCMDYMDSR